MHKVIESKYESLMHHSISQPTVAACAGDGSCGRCLLSLIADANLALSAISCTRTWLGVINSAPACAYVAGTLALALSHAHRSATPQ